MKKIKVIISPDGSEVKTEVEGVHGTSCEDLTRPLIEALGDVIESEKKPEYYVEDVSFINEKAQ